ncbi:MAG: hypothetical protein ACW99A_18255 [Candidatus Kariarchaeaceae archaeon]|jgi:hypothetical protein
MKGMTWKVALGIIIMVVVLAIIIILLAPSIFFGGELEKDIDFGEFCLHWGAIYHYRQGLGETVTIGTKDVSVNDICANELGILQQDMNSIHLQQCKNKCELKNE